MEYGSLYEVDGCKHVYYCPFCDEELRGREKPGPGDLTVCHACLRPLRFAFSQFSRSGLTLVEVVLDALPAGDRLEVQAVIDGLRENAAAAVSSALKQIFVPREES